MRTTVRKCRARVDRAISLYMLSAKDSWKSHPCIQTIQQLLRVWYSHPVPKQHSIIMFTVKLITVK